MTYTIENKTNALNVKERANEIFKVVCHAGGISRQGGEPLAFIIAGLERRITELEARLAVYDAIASKSGSGDPPRTRR